MRFKACYNRLFLTGRSSKMDTKSLLRLAEETALMAGKELISNRKQWAVIESEAGRDVKVKADRLVEAIILENLQQATDFPILTEERGWQVGVSDEHYLWVVDPLDGSFNYCSGMPACCVSIALYQADNPILGVVYDFNRHELFSGIVGEGAWLNRLDMRVSTTAEMSRGVLQTGFPMQQSLSDQAFIEFMHFAGQWRKVRMIGSAALALAYVACGRADCYHENHTMFWDVAAGLVLVKAAGGAISMRGERLDARQNVYASNGKVMPWVS